MTNVTNLIHSLPTFFLLAALILGWRWEWAGAVGFIAFGIWYLVSVRGFDAGRNLLLASMPVLAGLPFLMRWFFRKQIRA